MKTLVEFKSISLFIFTSIILSTLIIVIAIYIISSSSTIRCLVSFVLLVITLAFLFQAYGWPMFSILYLLTYVGAILIFFIFTIMLIDTRFEKTETILEILAKMWSISALPAFFAAILMFIPLAQIVIYFHSINVNYPRAFTLAEAKNSYFQLQRFHTFPLNPSSYFVQQNAAYEQSLAHIGFSAYSQHGVFIVFVGMILVLVLVGALGVVRESHIVILECKRVKFRRNNVKDDYCM